jgi:D-glycerate 3-kinase
MTRDHDTGSLALAQRIVARAGGQFGGPLFVGLCGSQGSGKSTLAATLREHLNELGLSVAILSLDDLYLPPRARTQLSRTVHPLLKTRGVPGTHEVSLGLRVFAALKAGDTVLLPSFDKAVDDRRPQAQWLRVETSVDVVIFEGWCVGAIAQDEAALMHPVNSLEAVEDPQGTWRRYVNSALAHSYQSLFAQIDMLILLVAPSFDVVYHWRLEQETDLRRMVAERGEDASRLMTDVELRRFVSHYERLTRHILEEMPTRADVVVRLDAQRKTKIEYRNS